MNVIFPTGLVVEYPQAKSMNHENSMHRLFTKHGGDFVALVPGEAIVEASNANRKMYNIHHEDFMRWVREIHPDVEQEYLTTKLVSSKLEK